ncbi:PH domain-containing protein [Rothia nasimurium]|uniref:PH domain-containing protein n=1 Tax=Rothia nasimurium TaxID=85336 RepID=UPI003B9E6985
MQNPTPLPQEHTSLTSSAPEPAGPAVLEWRRAHPLSPLVRAWLIVAVLGYTIVTNGLEEFIAGARNFDLRELGEAGPPDTIFFTWSSIFGGYWYLAVLAVIFVLLLLPFISTWFFYRFAVDGQNVYVKSGMLFKTERKARLDRVQSIDVNRPFVARLLGLAEVKFDVADGASSALKVEFLRYREARDLREQLLAQVRALKAGVAAPSPSAAPATGGPSPSSDLADRLADHVTENFLGIKDADERLIVQVPVGRLLGSMLLTLGWIVGVLAVALVVGLLLWAEASLATIFASNVALIMGIASSAWKRFNTGFNFSLSTSADGLKTRFGFADTTTQSLPAGRVQKIEVVQPLLWRLTGWYRVKVTLLGKGEGQGDFAGELLPVGTFDEVMRVLPLVLPSEQDGGVSLPQLQAGLGGAGSEQGFIVSPASARVFDWFTYRRNGFALTPALLVVRSGRWIHSLTLLPHGKVQALALSQGPWQRRLGLANVQFKVAGSALGVTVQNTDAEVARALLVRQAQLGVGSGNQLGAPAGRGNNIPPFELLPLPGADWTD